MIEITVKINSLEDAKKGVQIVEGSTKENTIEAKAVTIGILEGGMQSGKTSVMFCLEMPDGTVSVGQCSALQFEAVAGALNGAKQRFGDNGQS